MSACIMATYLALLACFRCSECVEDPEVPYARDCELICVACGAHLCGHHIIQHLQEMHGISIESRGAVLQRVAGGVA